VEFGDSDPKDPDRIQILFSKLVLKIRKSRSLKSGIRNNTTTGVLCLLTSFVYLVVGRRVKNLILEGSSLFPILRESKKISAFRQRLETTLISLLTLLEIFFPAKTTEKTQICLFFQICLKKRDLFQF
jgi:hypothetical protein